MTVNRKLKSIYFQWAINYDGPPPRGLSVTFKEYLYNEHYSSLHGLFYEGWLQDILAECNLPSEQELDEQIVLIESDFKIYSDQQRAKIMRQDNKRLNIYYAKCAKEEVLPF